MGVRLKTNWAESIRTWYVRAFLFVYSLFSAELWLFDNRVSVAPAALPLPGTAWSVAVTLNFW